MEKIYTSKNLGKGKDMSDFKNTIVLKNIPSNLVEEAIIVLKENKKAMRLQKIENKKGTKENIVPINKDYVIKEAELVISNYLKTREDEEEKQIQISKNVKYLRLKKYAYIATAIIFIQFLVSLL